MRLLPLLCGAAEALNCSRYGLEAFDKQHVVTRLFETPPLTTNRTIYFNPCSYLEDVPECGNDNYLCAIDTVDVNGTWVTAAVKLAGSAEHGMEIEQAIQVDDGLIVRYWGAEWGDLDAPGGLNFDCSNGTSLRAEALQDVEVHIDTPLVCGLRLYPGCPVSNRFAWGKLVLWVLFVVGGLLAAYTGAALFITSRSRPLGPLLAEAANALHELPLLVRESVLTLYERATGHGTGRNMV